MFYYYKFLDKHKINNLHKYYEEIVVVWCSAQTGTAYTNALLKTADCNEFVTNAPVDFRTAIEDIYSEFTQLTNAQKVRIKKGFIINNQIENLCEGKRLSTLTFDEIKKMRKGLDEKLLKFGYYMYNNALKSASFITKNGTLKKHFDDLKIENRKTNSSIGVCPFCGLSELKTEYHTQDRDAYDHYLPKSLYPFSSVNFKNLAPICDTCNGKSNKGTKDPIFDKKLNKKRKAFYPYCTQSHKIDIEININGKLSLGKLKTKDVVIKYTCTGKSTEVNTWREVFGIDKQLPPKVLDKQVNWLETLIISYSNLRADTMVNGEAFTMSFLNYLKSKIKTYKTKGISDMYFLKSAYLEELVRQGRIINYCQPIANNLKVVI